MTECFCLPQLFPVFKPKTKIPKTFFLSMLTTALICMLCILFQPICVKLMGIPIERLEVSGNSLFVENNLRSIVTALFIHDGLSHSLYNVLTTIPIIYTLESHYELPCLFLLFVMVFCGIIGFISSIYYNKLKYGNDVYLFIPHCGFSHSMYGIAVFSCYLFPNEHDYLPNVFGAHPLMWILITFIVPDFFVKTPKHSKKFWCSLCYLLLIMCWVFHKALINVNGIHVNSALYLLLFDSVFIKNKIYYRMYLQLPAMCDHCGHFFGMLSGLFMGFMYSLVVEYHFDLMLSFKHAVRVFCQWPLCVTLLFALYRVKVNW